MIRSIRAIFCDQEHGTGDVTFPNLNDLATQQFIDNAPSARALRSEAKKLAGASWPATTTATCAPRQTRKRSPLSKAPKHLQMSTMEVRVPPGTIIRLLSIVASDPSRRRLTSEQRTRLRELWQLSGRERRPV